MDEGKAASATTRTIRVVLGAAVVAAVVHAAPAMAFADAAQDINTQTCAAFNAARSVLITAAVLAVIIGLAPMLWGQVKVKWIVSSLCACVLFSAIPSIVSAFAGGVSGCG